MAGECQESVADDDAVVGRDPELSQIRQIWHQDFKPCSGESLSEGDEARIVRAELGRPRDKDHSAPWIRCAVKITVASALARPIRDRRALYRHATGARTRLDVA
ncbi:MAG: hypothetical protein JSU82_16610 [Rhodospirillales bacterium]|nr:MAG: hypothetical protein JSU82_16610 [Rhodospirillales bacterium]